MRLKIFLYLVGTITMMGFDANFSAHAQVSKNGHVQVVEPGVIATAPGQTSAAVYLSIKNLNTKTDHLISITSPVATEAVLHSMTMNSNMMRMREVGRLSLAPTTEVSLQPDSGYHIMLTGLKQPLKAGDEIVLTLNFDIAGPVTIVTKVVKDKASLRRSGS